MVFWTSFEQTIPGSNEVLHNKIYGVFRRDKNYGWSGGDHHGYNANKREHVLEDSTRNLSESCKYKLTYRLLQIVLHVMILCTDTCLFHYNNEPCELNYVRICQCILQ